MLEHLTPALAAAVTTPAILALAIRQIKNSYERDLNTVRIILSIHSGNKELDSLVVTKSQFLEMGKKYRENLYGHDQYIQITTTSLVTDFTVDWLLRHTPGG